MPIENARETQEMTSKTIWGVVDVPVAQTGRLFRAGSAFVALNIENVVLSMERTISEHEKLTPRNTILAIRTRVLIFC